MVWPTNEGSLNRNQNSESTLASAAPSKTSSYRGLVKNGGLEALPLVQSPHLNTAKSSRAVRGRFVFVENRVNCQIFIFTIYVHSLH